MFCQISFELTVSCNMSLWFEVQHCPVQLKNVCTCSIFPQMKYENADMLKHPF